MRLIIKGRQGYKTTGMLHTSEATGYPIIVETQKRLEQLKNQAEEIGAAIPEPLTVDMLKCGLYRVDNCLIDEAYDIIGQALNSYLNTNVVAATLSDNIREEYNNRKVKK